VFVAASAVCALAPDVGWLIAARTVQGAGSALVMPLAMALLGAAVPPERRGVALGAEIGRLDQVISAAYRVNPLYLRAMPFSLENRTEFGVQARLI
jgi:MFS family permease